jgi:predicted nucleic acid-binding protein
MERRTVRSGRGRGRLRCDVDIKPIPGFSALKLKEELQAKVQARPRVEFRGGTGLSKLRVYVDTSVVGGCFDDEFAEWSNALFEKARDGEILILISSVLIDELSRSPEHVRAVIDDLPKHTKELITESDEVERLHSLYVSNKIVGPASANDARHVACATVAKANVLVSWNMKHLVHYDKIWRYNAVNQIENYQRIDIRTPQEVV